MYKRNFYDVDTEVINGEWGALSYTAYCPVIRSPETPACHTINNFSRHSCAEFINYARVNSELSYEKRSVARCFQLMYASRFILSIKYEMSIFDDEMHPYTAVSGAVWNTKSGSAVELREFFRTRK